jgi:hypothetical protein
MTRVKKRNQRVKLPLERLPMYPRPRNKVRKLRVRMNRKIRKIRMEMVRKNYLLATWLLV